VPLLKEEARLNPMGEAVRVGVFLATRGSNATSKPGQEEGRKKINIFEMHNKSGRNSLNVAQRKLTVNCRVSGYGVGFRLRHY